MGTIIAVHGTFAHVDTSPGPDSNLPATETVELWWKDGSTFHGDMERMLRCDGKPVRTVPLIWSGANSERARREAGRDLLKLMQQHEDRGEPYAIIGHSHGGSVVAKALLEAARRKQKLPGLQRWITVGTPFVELRKEMFLFQRLPLIFKALFVASLMLLIMFAATLIGDLVTGSINFQNERQVFRLALTTALTTLPLIVFLIVAYAMDWRRLFHHRERHKRRAREYFEDRWLALTHEDDEAVRGLSSLSKSQFNIFSQTFAAPAIGLFSVFLLPLAYLWILNTPWIMVSIADTLKTQVYDVASYQAIEEDFEQRQRTLRGVRRDIRRARQALDASGVDARARLDAESQMRSLQQRRRELVSDMRESFPEFRGISRALRFKRRFLERGGVACPNEQLCGGGRDLALNSKLLFHLVTDEASALVLDPEMRPTGATGRLIAAIIPIILVPIVFAIVAIILVFLLQKVAHLVSRVLSRLLDRMTWFEINRAALGNDTEAEVAVRAGAKPPWIARQPGFLPAPIADLIAAKSNEAAVISIAKFRNAISDLAFTEKAADRQETALALLSWEELIHMVYFEVPEFRALIARALSEATRFERVETEFEGVGSVSAWLNDLTKPTDANGKPAAAAA